MKQLSLYLYAYFAFPIFYAAKACFLDLYWIPAISGGEIIALGPRATIECSDTWRANARTWACSIGDQSLFFVFLNI